MKAAPLADAETPMAELPEDQKRFRRALEKFMAEQSDNRSGDWANFVHGLLKRSSEPEKTEKGDVQP